MALPVSLIQDHNLVPPWLQSDLLLRKHLDLVPHHVQPPAKARIDHHASNPHTTKGGPESQKQKKCHGGSNLSSEALSSSTASR
jgi:hypothetical protein